MPLPDPACTPGAINPTVTLAVLQDSAFRTECVRNCITTLAQKHVVYGNYGITEPAGNVGDNMVCELDHLVPLEIGGGDSLANIWPQCGPDAVTLNERFFKQKDMVENYLADEVRSGARDQAATQKAVAQDWTQFLAVAKAFCAAHSCGVQ